MSANTLSIHQSVENKCAYMPYWLTADRAANDVIVPSPAKRLYEQVEGQSVPLHESVVNLQRQMCADEAKMYVDHIQTVSTIVNRVSETPVIPELTVAMRDAISQVDGRLACQVFYKHTENVIEELCSSVDSMARELILGLHRGTEIWEKVACMEEYGLCLGKNGDDQFELSVESTDFFKHFYAEVSCVPVRYQKAYSHLLNTLIAKGSGAWQLDVSQYYGAMECTNKLSDVKIIRKMMQALEAADEDKQVAVLDKWLKKTIIKDFIDDIEENFSYGESVRDLLVDEAETVARWLWDGIYLLEFEIGSKSLMDSEGISIDDIANINDDEANSCQYAALLRSVAKAHQTFKRNSTGEHALSIREECTPFGIVISPLKVSDIEDSIDGRLQGVYEGFMNNGECCDAVVVDLTNPDWKICLNNHLLNTGLLVALIMGVTEVISV